MKGVGDPVYFCPICGKRLSSKHRCDESVLRAIDGANTRAENHDSDFTVQHEFHVTESDRINDGFEMLDDEDECEDY